MALGDIVHPAFAAARRVILAREPAFTVGRLAVHPSTRQISCENQRETIEPRVLQVLVALARADGEVVSKDELFQCCWEGRIVGEDAINRVISRLRRVAQTIGGGSFQVDTIRGVGYRLVDGDQPIDIARHIPMCMAGAGPSRRSVVAGSILAAAAAATGAAAWLLQRTTHNPTPLAVKYYQEGLATRGQNSLELAERGVAMFREATRIDPLFAEAWGALAWSYRGLLEFPYGPRRDPARLRELSRSAAARALELDPDNPDAQAALLLAKPLYGNWAELEEGCRQLLRQHPGHSILEYNLGTALIHVGRWREATPFFRAVAERESFWPLAHLALTHSLYEGGKTQEAEDLVEEGMKRFPRHIDFWLMKVRHLIAHGRLQEAVAFSKDIANQPAERSAIQPEIEFETRMLSALVEGSARAKSDVIRAASNTARQLPGYIGQAAVTAALLGDLDLSFAMYQGYYFGEGSWAFARGERLRTATLFTSSTYRLRNDRRFPGLLQRIGLIDYWRATGTAPDYRRFPQPEYRLPVGQSSD